MLHFFLALQPLLKGHANNFLGHTLIARYPGQVSERRCNVVRV